MAEERNETVPDEDISDSDLDEFLDLIIDHQDEILANKTEIESSFGSVFADGREVDVFEVLGNEINAALMSQVEESTARDKIINGIYSLILNFESGAFEDLKNKTDNEELLSLIVDLRSKYGLDFRAEANHYFRGSKWWSNVKTNTGYRSGEVYLENELIIDQSDRIEFSSNLDGQIILAKHLVKQVNSAQNSLGESIIEDLNKEIVEDLKEDVDDLLEDMEDYEEKYSVDLSGPRAIEHSTQGE